MAPKHQYSLDLIQRKVNESIIQQRAVDGYINATELCRVAGQPWFRYVMQETTGHFLRALAAKEGLLGPQLCEQQSDGAMWVHPKVAIHLAQWLSPEFAVQVADWVYDWMGGGGKPAAQPTQLPYHLERHMLNFGKVPHTHFSILQEMTTSLIAPLEAQGYSLPHSMVPDISQGKLFCKFAREKLGIDTDALPTYDHQYPDGRVVPAKLYPVEFLGHFRKFISEEWLPERAEAYFRKKDPQALPMLDKVLRIEYKPPTQASSPAVRRVTYRKKPAA